jgi:archaellin
MGKSIFIGITTIVLLFSLLLSGLIVGSVITNESPEIDIENDFEQMLEEVIDETSTYIQILEQKGKYNEINKERRIDQIILYISPLFTKQIDISNFKIQLNNGESVRFLNYSGNVKNLDNYSIFNHPIWNNLDGNNFGFISIIDLDESLIKNNILNDCSDHTYIVFKLPYDMTLAKNEKLTVTIFPLSGITRTTILKAHFSTRSIIDF